MKKLMTMLAAVATAFGLYAADTGFLSGAGFDTSDTVDPANGKYTWLMGDPTGEFVAGYWTGTEKSSIVYEKYTYTGTHPAQFDKDAGRNADQYLKIDSGTDLVSQRILSGTATKTIGADGLYFDGLVQFTSFEDEAPAIAEGAKIALFPMVDDPEAAEPVSHLIVAAQGTVETNLWTTDTSINDGWHRVTIKMINNIMKAGETAQAGFVVYVDGTAVTSTDAKDALDADKLTSEAKYFYNDGKLFGSLIKETAEITDVAFGGKGAIDEIAFTETAPSFAGSPKFAYLTGATNIKSFNYSTETWEYGDAPLEVRLVGSDTGTASVTGITAVEGYFPTNTAETVAVTAGRTSTVGGAKALGATVVINDVPMYFETAAAALAELNDEKYADPTTAALTLNAEESGAIELANANITLTLDLAGKTINQGEAAAAITLTAGSLKIIDSDGNGEVNGNGVAEDNVAILAADEGATLEIADGTFNGVVAVLDDILTISSEDPAFAYAANVGEDGECTISYEMSEALADKQLVADDEDKPAYWVVGTPKDYVAQVITAGGATTNGYETLQAAIDATLNGDTVRIIAAVTDEPLQVTGTSTNDYAITIQNDASVTWTKDAGTQKYGMTINGAKVTFTGTGSWTKEAGSASLIQAGASLPAAIIVEGGTFVSGELSKSGDANYKDAPSNAISSKWGSIVVNGGSFINYRGDQGRCVRAEGTKTSDEAYPEAGKVSGEKVDLYATLVVNGGEFTVVCPDGHSESTLGITAHHVAVDNKGQATGSVTINGGKFKSPEWSVKNIMNAYCGEGYKLKDNGEGWLVKTAIDYATYKVTADAGVESYVVSNGTAEVAADAKFDIDDSVVLTVYPTLKANYELVTDDCVLTATLTEEKEYELKVVTKESAPEIPAVAPGGSPVEVKAEDAEKVVIKAKSPDTSVVSDEDYTDYFKKSVVDIGGGKVRVSAVLDEKAIEFAESVEDLGEEVSKIAAGAESVTIAAKPGLYYYVEEADDVTKIAEPERDRVMAKGDTVTVPTTKFEGSGFYRLNCSTTQRGIVTGGQD